jgi:putative transposase
MPTIRHTYRCQMRPTREQEQKLFRQAGARRWVWNWALAGRKAYYAECGKGIYARQQQKELPVLKSIPETAWLKDIDAQLLQETLRDLDKAYVAFFEGRARFPRFKSRKTDNPRFRISQRVKVVDGKVWVPKVGWVRVRQSRTVEGVTKSATFKRDAMGHWFVTLVVAFETPDVPLPPPNPENVVGIDAGLKDFAVLSNGERIENPRFYRKAQRKLRRAQRVLSRRQEGSNRRSKARRQVARVHQKTADKRKDFLHKLSTKLVKRFDGVCIEDLCIKGLVRTKLARSFADAAHGEFRRMLEYKSLWHRKHLMVVGRYFPSTKTCGACGHVNHALTLADREWTCSVCGVAHDRDHNASCNIKTEGLRLFAAGHAEKENARGRPVRLPKGSKAG